jgi:hypothetical protein
MRAWPLHVVFATILVGSLAAKERANDEMVQNDNLEPAITRVAQSYGLALRGDVTPPRTGIPALAFEAPGCSQPVVVFMLVTFDEESIVPLAGASDDVLRYTYIDRSWEKPDRLAFFIERMKYAALATFGLTRYVPSKHFLLVDAPSHCQTADAIDWRNVWNRDYVAAGRPDTEPATR